jgi:hypothetical protein
MKNLGALVALIVLLVIVMIIPRGAAVIELQATLKAVENQNVSTYLLINRAMEIVANAGQTTASVSLMAIIVTAIVAVSAIVLVVKALSGGKD